MKLIVNLIRALRPKQWTKNAFLFAPLIFSFQFLDFHLLLKTAVAFFSFSLFCGIVYIINDLADIEKDRLHPEKRNRPIASGQVSKSAALSFVLIILLLNIPLIVYLGKNFAFILLVYLALNLFYSFLLKHVVVLDVMIVAAGFVLRIMAGGAVDEIFVSDWILITTFLLALFLALIKRRQELVRFSQELHNARKSLSHYSVHFLDQMISVATAAAIMTYVLYTMSGEIKNKYGSIKLIYTVPFVIFGLFRYLYLVYIKGWGENPSDVILKDPAFSINLVFWLITFIALVVFFI